MGRCSGGRRREDVAKGAGRLPVACFQHLTCNNGLDEQLEGGLERMALSSVCWVGRVKEGG